MTEAKETAQEVKNHANELLTDLQKRWDNGETSNQNAVKMAQLVHFIEDIEIYLSILDQKPKAPVDQSKDTERKEDT